MYSKALKLNFGVLLMSDQDVKSEGFLKANILFFVYLLIGALLKAFLDKWNVPFTSIFIVFVPFLAAFATSLSHQSYLKVQFSQEQRRKTHYNFYFMSLLFKLFFVSAILLAPAILEQGDMSYLVSLVENKLSENPVAISFLLISFLVSDFIFVFLGIIAGYLVAPKLNKKIEKRSEPEFFHPTTHFVYLFALLYMGMKAILFILPEEFITPYLGYVFVLLATLLALSAYQNVYDTLSKHARALFKRHLWLASIFIDLPVLMYLGLMATNTIKSAEMSVQAQTFVDMYSGDFIYLAIALVILGNYFLIGLSFILFEFGMKKKADNDGK
jgi:uncharacterized membrane protein